LATEWDSFRHLDWKAMATKMSAGAWVFDARNCTDHRSVRAAGLKLWAVGK